MAYPKREEAQSLLREAENCNPGPWGNHSRVAAYCAEIIAAAAGLNPEKAYVLGLLHDIGRKFGVTHMAHVRDGYRYMTELGYDEVARVCLTHSFSLHTTDVFVGNRDIPEEDEKTLSRLLAKTEYDEYDRLIQLCDCLAGAEGIVDMEERMDDVRRRYGFYPEKKGQSYRDLRRYFEEKCGCGIYELLGRYEP